MCERFMIYQPKYGIGDVSRDIRDRYNVTGVRSILNQPKASGKTFVIIAPYAVTTQGQEDICRS
jgi:hypothetical protein